MPNSVSESKHREIQIKTTSKKRNIFVCKKYFEKVVKDLRKEVNLKEILTKYEDCHYLSSKFKNCEEINVKSMWSRLNTGIIYTTKGLRKAENEFVNAVITGKLKDVQQLLKSGVNPNVKDADGIAMLHVVAERGDTSIGKCILNTKNVEVDIKTLNGETPLITAIRCNRRQFVLLLLSNGANANVTNSFGTTPLLIACSLGLVEITKILLHFNANPNCQDAFGDVPLVKAMIENPNKAIVQLLLRYGANPNLRTMRKHPLLLELALHCRSKLHMDMINMLIRAGVNLNMQSSISKYTALHIASIGENIPLVKHLLEKGAKMDLLDFMGRKPVEVASEHGHIELVQVFKTWKKHLEEKKRKDSEAKKSSLANKSKPLSTEISVTTNKSVTFSINDSDSNLSMNSNCTRGSSNSSAWIYEQNQ